MHAVVEGLHRKFSRRRGVAHILCVGSEADAVELLKVNPSPICILGRGMNGKRELGGIPVKRFPRDLPEVLRMVG
jgi:hypothetical protein